VTDTHTHVRFEGPEGSFEVSYTARQASKDLGLAFATTVHKSQGSEWPVVVVVLHSQHYVMLRCVGGVACSSRCYCCGE
jgi:ATP-dependent exoDNAse (exonuclease V) alpha subunit